jgi:LPXTG-motif cell wall-anchored protein
VAGETIAGMLPSTGEPVTLFAFGLLGLAGIGLLMRRISRRAR